MDELVFVHLSDIHFSKPGKLFDLDSELRNQLELDVQRMTESFEETAGILVCGDIAFSGSIDEYQEASSWIRKLLGLAKVESGNVWVVPGNHDINWETIRSSKLLRDAHTTLRGTPNGSIDSCFKEYLKDNLLRLFEPLKDFNLFASSFDCDSTPVRLFWEKDLELNDGSILRIRGMNSSIISDEFDNDRGKSLMLSSFQSVFNEEPNITYMSMCHHPPQRILEEDELEDCLSSRVAIQLFGHKHRQRLVPIGDRLRVSAGAVHPARDEGNWEPCYNWFSTRVDGIDSGRKLIVDVWPRVWRRASRTFEPEYHDGKEFQRFILPLKPWNGSKEKKRQAQAATKSPLTVTKVRYFMDPKRKLVYRFLSLPYTQIIEIAVGLGLLRDQDKGVEDLELFKRFIARAEEKGREGMAQLWDLVEDKYGSDKDTVNPFRTY